jgi:hypothetical protein
VLQAACIALTMVMTAGCAMLAPPGPAFGSQHHVVFAHPPAQAARCFARNAEAHSSALVSEVQPRGMGMDVIVRVKNGVTYATATIDPRGAGASGRITLMVVSSAGQAELLRVLTQGC